MKPGGGKRKGASFERDTCKKLSLWVSGRKREDLFWRSAMSGGRATVAHKRGVKLNYQSGDICAVHPEGHVLTDFVYFECKHLKKFTLDSLVCGGGALNKIWRETAKQAKQYGKIPVLIAQQNRWPTLFITSNDGVTWFSKFDIEFGDALSLHAFDTRPSLQLAKFMDVLQCQPPK